MPTVIHDTTPDDAFRDPTRGTGLVLPDGFSGPAHYAGVATPFPRELVLSKQEIIDRIKEREAQTTRHRDLAEHYGLKCKDQQQTNYCWINSPTYCLEYVRLLQNQKVVELSPASAGAPIQNFRNVGGYGKLALQWIEERGLVPTELWPDNAIDRRYYTPENRQAALDYRASEWWVFEPGDLLAVLSCSVGLGIPVSVGLNWWSHQVTYADGRLVDGEPWPVIRNSWGMGWQDMGYAVLQGQRARPDDAVAPAVALSS